MAKEIEVTMLNNSFQSSFCIISVQKLLETESNISTVAMDGYLVLTDTDGKDHHIKVAKKGDFGSWKHVDYFKVIHETDNGRILTMAVYATVWSDKLSRYLSIWEKVLEEVSVKGVIIRRWSIDDDIRWYMQNERQHRPRTDGEKQNRYKTNQLSWHRG